MLTTKRYEYLQIEKIAIHPVIGNHRQLSPAKVSHLEKDILTNGLLEPLVVWERTSGSIIWSVGSIVWRQFQYKEKPSGIF